MLCLSLTFVDVCQRESLREAGGGQDESQVVLIALGPFEFASLFFIQSPYSRTPCFWVLGEVLGPTTMLLCLRPAVDTGSAFLDLWVSL